MGTSVGAVYSATMSTTYGGSTGHVTANGGIIMEDMRMEKPKVRRAKESTSYHVSSEAKRLLKAVAKSRGVSQSAILEQAIRDYAKTFDITPASLPDQDE